MLLIAAPAMILIMLAIKVTSRGNAIFTQRRYGLDGQQILVYKFRTMTTCEDGDQVTPHVVRFRHPHKETGE